MKNIIKALTLHMVRYQDQIHSQKWHSEYRSPRLTYILFSSTGRTKDKEEEIEFDIQHF